MPQRTPLAPTSQSRRKRQELTPYERGRISQAHMDGVSIRKIAQLMNRPSSTIGDTIKQAPSRPQGASQPRSGRPKQYTERDTRRIIRLIKSKPFWSYRRVLHELDLKLSPATMHRILKAIWYTQMTCKETAFAYTMDCSSALPLGQKT